MAVQSIAGRRLGDYSDTLIFLDEIQEYRHLFTLLKFLKEDGRYKIIASGSLLGVVIRKTSSIPIGSVKIKRMYPMDFEEYLWANGISDEFIAEVKNTVLNRSELSEGIHNRLMDLFKDYLICGGLPQCVDLFLSENDIISLRDLQKDIHTLYGDDATKYDEENKLHTKNLFDMIPSNIENKRKRIFLKDIENKPHVRFADYEEDFDTLVHSGIALEVKCVSEPKFRLLESSKRSLLKLYMSDVGLLTSVLYGYNVMSLRGDGSGIDLDNVYRTFAACILNSNGHELYYMDNKRLGEVDFLLDDYDSLSVKAIEIKSGKDYKKHASIDSLVKESESVSEGFVFSNSGTIDVDGKITYLPIYALIFL